MIGPFVNAAATLAGGICGTALAGRLGREAQGRLMLVLGLAAMGMGVTMTVRMQALPPVILALVAGAVLGEALRIEQALARAATALRHLVDRVAPGLHGTGLSHAEHADRLVAAMVLFVASGTGVFGAMTEGITGDPTILLVKAGLDLVTAVIFAAELGPAVALIAVPQLAAQLVFLCAGRAILPLVSPGMAVDFQSLGGMVMVATGLRICGIAPFPVANLLPALALAMPLSAAAALLR